MRSRCFWTRTTVSGWCAFFHPGVVLPTHYHTGTAHLWTLSGKWNYLEYPDQPQTAGSYLFEPGSSIHTLNVHADNTELTETLMVVSGSNINFDQDGNFVGYWMPIRSSG
jgi:quercetin dioxygenase-like cupin family protein